MLFVLYINIKSIIYCYNININLTDIYIWIDLFQKVNRNCYTNHILNQIIMMYIIIVI